MATYSVHFPSMEAAVEGFNNVHSRLTETTNNLAQRVTNNMADMQGDTSSGMREAHQRLYTAQEEFSNAVRGANVALANIHEEYGNGEAQGVSIWAR